MDDGYGAGGAADGAVCGGCGRQRGRDRAVFVQHRAVGQLLSGVLLLSFFGYSCSIRVPTTAEV